VNQDGSKVDFNGETDFAGGIVWGTAPAEGDANMETVPGVVRAYDATDFDPGPDASAPAKLRLLWQQEGFTYSKFCPPVLADGRLLVPTYDGRVDVYMLK
jgi:outer membrane protein assembly factor BamB